MGKGYLKYSGSLFVAADNSVGLFRGRYNNHSDIGHGVGMQGDFDFVFANCFERAIRQAYVSFSSFYTKCTDSFSDVGVGYRTEQTAVHASFLGDSDGLAFQFGLASLCIGQNCSLTSLELSTAGFEIGQGSFGSALGFTLGDQEVAGIAIFYGYYIAQIAQAANFF